MLFAFRGKFREYLFMVAALSVLVVKVWLQSSKIEQDY